MVNYLILLFMVLSVSSNELEKSFIDANNLFTSAVYQEVIKTADGNCLVSPFSAEIILALVQSGAKGPTAEELRTSLRLPIQEKIESTFRSVLSNLKLKNETYSLRTANKIYLKNDFAIKNEFKKIASDIFDSELENIDFSNSSNAAKIINEWVEKQTENKIKNLISPGILTELTNLLLINSLYFKANWSVPFFPPTTIKSAFYQTAKKVVQVDTMQESLSNFQYCENEELKAKFLELSFEGEDASMIFVLPFEKEGLTLLESQLDKIFLPQNFSWEYVNVSIPKFKIESTVDFKQVLKNLNVKKAFTPGEADFSGISDKEVAISDAVQKTFIDVNERGVEASAATFIRLVDYSGLSSPPQEFHADHPFIFYIKVKDLILFAGRVILPSY